MTRPFLLAFLLPLSAFGFDTAGLRLNQLQVIGTHNSYKAPMQPELLAWIGRFSDDAEALDYSHPPLPEQLDLGLRGLELDVANDPEGGLYACPKGQELLKKLGEDPLPFDAAGAMRSPGFKVIHSVDFDFRSNYPTLDLALQALSDWSDQNPDHLPAIVTVNLKTDADPIPDATELAPFDAEALDRLDAAIVAGLGADRLITPDLVRADAPSLNEAILTNGWPLIDEVRGRFLWVLDEGGAKHRRYLEGHESLAGRVFFTSTTEAEPESAFLIINDPVRHADRIRRLVEAGYLVRTRADSMTVEARRGDLSRFRAACDTGAQLISTDYPRADERLGTGYCVVFEGEAYSRRNPVTAPPEASP